jgi:hypothetical protein
MGSLVSQSEHCHVDTLDLYTARQRTAFLKQAAESGNRRCAGRDPQPATAGDTNTLQETLTQCGEHIREVAIEIDNSAVQMNPEGPRGSAHSQTPAKRRS